MFQPMRRGDFRRFRDESRSESFFFFLARVTSVPLCLWDFSSLSLSLSSSIRGRVVTRDFKSILYERRVYAVAAERRQRAREFSELLP